MAFPSGMVAFAPPPPPPPPPNAGSNTSKVRKIIPSSNRCCSTSSSSVTNNITTIESQETSKKFSYSRASPSVRWPNRKELIENHNSQQTQFPVSPTTPQFHVFEDECLSSEPKDKEIEGKDEPLDTNDETLKGFGWQSRRVAKKMTKLALKRAKDWRQRVQFLTDKILGLKSNEFVADVLDDKLVQMTPTDFCFLVKGVGKSSWQRALEVYEWLNLCQWYSPNARMLATILAVLGKANQESLAVEIFERSEEGVDSSIQVYNAMMGVYARNGRFGKVQETLNRMREKGCEPDLVSFNTLINARFKSTSMEPNMALDLLGEVKRSGLQPDIITYNTLLSACSRDSNLEEAVKIFKDLEANRCQPDLWTYNAMLSVYGRCGLCNEAELLFKDIESKGFVPDAVTYNSLLYAFAREGHVDKVKKLCDEMVKLGFGEDEMTYNTVIHMYGKLGQYDLALQLYRDMKSRGRDPDVVTYTVLVDSLGKANKIAEAANVMSEMVDAGIKPTLRTYSALICGYAKAGKRAEAERTFDRMVRSGIKPDLLAYSVMLDIYLKFDGHKAMMLYNNMVRDGFTPDLSLYELLVQSLQRENKDDYVHKVINDMQKLCELNPQVISSILVKGEFYDYAAKMLKLAILEGFQLDQENLLSILSSYSSSGRHSDALNLLDFLKEHSPGSHHIVTEALIVILCKSNQLDAALAEYRKSRNSSLFNGSCSMYESLIKACEEAELFSEASQVLSDMTFIGARPSKVIYTSLALMYCKMGFPETAHDLMDRAESKGISVDEISVYVDLIEAYGKVNLLEKAESVVGSLRQRFPVVDRKAWNALIQMYASKGQYEKARAAFNTMMRDGPSPTVESINGLMRALIVDERLNELYVVVQELQDMGFKISKSSIFLMLDAFVQTGNVFEVKKIYNGMKAAGYFPTMNLYRVMIGLLCRVKHVRDAEAMVDEMVEVGFKPDLFIWNSLLRLYTNIEDYRKTAQVYQKIKDDGFKPDENTYNTLIVMYCRDRRPEEGLSLMDEMVKEGLDAKLTTYKSLIAAFGKLQMVEQAEELFGKMRRKGYNLDRSFYHIMMKIYRSTGQNSKSEELLKLMKEAGIEPTIATMHLLMISYGSSGNPEEAEKVLNGLKSSGESLSTLTYCSVIESYFKNRDYIVGIQKLTEMRREGIEPDHRIWTCFIRAASLCKTVNEAMMILNAIKDAGFDLPIELLKNSESMVMEIDQVLGELKPVEDNAALNFINAVEDLLWAFELRATASWVFQLAVKKDIYRHDVFRVADKDWGADFRKLSAGAALVGLTLWLDHMQDASLEGFPLSPKSVVLITGVSEYNDVSLNSTLKAYLWEMGSPFLPCKTRSGLLVAKAHSLRMWLKDSPFCLDLELRNSVTIPETNSMQLIEGCYIRRGLVPAFQDISARLGQVRPKKFARLALMSDEKRDKAIRADIDGRREKLEKVRRFGVTRKKPSQMRRYVRKEVVKH
ncbi:pentatricopeptide repeat-containing protein At3g18110, chloroplastic isoform X1 [Cynara cardunculus var. scolymus]|uniref:pentatricopeptide repeat-containing protein At3g18110, chloroplastic isoform X1 n=1 Tax=Cynara cardunculus var. scolymus TaxID=59895 RepID=UPI000D62ADE5|nr:pentatricopeptide repeat-containing protein At3g18110, chloroplastic isoform X1 [Cynara cardunculus var. scolymus]